MFQQKKTIMRKLKKYSDTKLLAMINGKKPQEDYAFAEIFNRYADFVRGYCICMLQNNDNAEDVFQQAMIALYKNVRSGVKVSNIGAYLIGISKNLFLNHIRDQKKTRSIELNDSVIDERCICENRELFDLIVRSLDLLDFEHREAFVLRKFFNMSFNEIAEFQNAKLSCVKMRVVRGQEKIKNILNPYIADLERNV